MASRSPFEILGVSPDAEAVVIRAAYRALARMYHPDARPGISVDESTARMSELNWAWDELDRDLSGWRVRVRHANASANEVGSTDREATDRAPSDQEADERRRWRAFTMQYRRPKAQALGWREWLGTDVVCTQCGCVLKNWVYKCPDCMQTGTWRRSKLHAVGHKLRIVGQALLYGTAFVIAGPLLIGLLAVPPILAFDAIGIGNGGVQDWTLAAQILLVVMIALEVGAWWAIAHWARVVTIVRTYWEQN